MVWSIHSPLQKRGRLQLREELLYKVLADQILALEDVCLLEGHLELDCLRGRGKNLKGRVDLDEEALLGERRKEKNDMSESIKVMMIKTIMTMTMPIIKRKEYILFSDNSNNNNTTVPTTATTITQQCQQQQQQ